MEVKPSQSTKGTSVLQIENFRYRKVYNLKSGDISWRCVVKTCKVRIRTASDEKTIVKSTGEHNHEANARKCERFELIARVKRKAVDDLCTRPRKILYKEITEMNETELAPKDLSLARRSIYYARRKIIPARPQSTKETHEALQSVDVTTSKSEKFVHVNDIEHGIIVFTTKINLEFLCKSSNVFMDGTFKCSVKHYQQLYTVHALQNGHYVPVVFALLSGKTCSIYTMFMRYLVELCSENGCVLAPDNIHIDFESAIMNVITAILPNARIKCCRFHFGQSLWRKIQSLGLSREYKTGTDVGKWLGLFFGLPFLPPSEVGDCFTFDIMTAMPDNPLCKTFADYVVGTYVDHDARYPPHLWAEIPSDAKRTNNGPESFHAHYNQHFYHPHPNIWNFINVIQDIQTTTYIKIRCIKISAPVSSAEKKKIESMEQAYEELQRNVIERIDYVKKLGHRFGAKTDL